ncbi:MAG: leucyl/phenylalanyl-tRNA--protein transferase [Gammaproteobacteria bacterium]|nr:leucyl/phenylalanyl-tRNA--protein transferase [Gammaproteobacteria bacterium]
MFLLNTDTKDLRFPPVDLASPEGLLAIGGDLRCERLLEAYRHGIFPWYSDDQPILWWSPDPRATLFPKQLHVSHSLSKTLKQKTFSVTFDTRFRSVIEACSLPRQHQAQPGTWITPDMIEAYCRLHEMGFAHSTEVWLNDKLVGGLYGVALGRAYFGESMFSTASNASKVGFVYTVRQLAAWQFRIIDCQVSSEHLTRFGAKDIRRTQFINELEKALQFPDKMGPWKLEDDLIITL